VYGVSTVDPFTFACVAALLIGAAGLASFIPALRAVRLNPVAALRQ
jgi:ABC-type lipoprotein release transport system permease subunit